METKPVPICNQHKQAKEWRQVTFEYNEDGISVRVPGIYAWVCPIDEEPAFTPDAANELILTMRELIESAKRARARRSTLTEYIVSVSPSEQLRPAV